MLIDCDSCAVRGRACDGCVVSVLFGEAPPAVVAPPGAEAEGAERRALQVLADVGFEVTVLSREETRPRLRVIGSRRGRSVA